MGRQGQNNSSSKQLSQQRAQAGKLGGQSGKGEKKARTSEQARAAVTARWDRFKKKIAARSEDDAPAQGD